MVILLTFGQAEQVVRPDLVRVSADVLRAGWRNDRAHLGGVTVTVADVGHATFVLDPVVHLKAGGDSGLSGLLIHPTESRDRFVGVVMVPVVLVDACDTYAHMGRN